ncbi:MAG: glutamine--fructose-6-phosphate transaminase (isomerizing) [Qingshengfaniella sp.]
MCGIVGVLSTHEAAPLLVEALKRLEYRGYDSAGIATIDEGRLDRRRAVGKLVNLSDLLVHDPLTGKTGIGHTRWATHGAPTANNAHPHRSGPVAVVHNGIIENFRTLRAELAEDGMACTTQTDTEVVAHLAARALAQGLPPAEAVRLTLDQIEGAFALLFLFEGESDLMIAARRGSPLAIGYGDGEMFVGSDAIALGGLAHRVSYLEEGDMAVIQRAGIQITGADGRPVTRPVQDITTDSLRADKGGHKHFMAKEIAEQPTVVGETLARYLSSDGQRVAPPLTGLDFSAVTRLSMVACGTAYYACMTAKYWFEHLAGIPVDVDIASEFRYREPPLPAGTLALFVSQSGETADTLAALRYCTAAGVPTLALTNVPESSIAREAAMALPILAGPEIGVASTKAFTCQLTALVLLALYGGRQCGRISATDEARYLGDLQALPGFLNAALALGPEIATVARDLSKAQDVLFLGRGAMFPLALEGALKLKEISYIHAEGYASGELKHGPIALVDRQVPVIVMAPSDPLFDKTVSNMQEVMAREGRVILLTDAEGAIRAGDGIPHVLRLPTVAPLIAPILYAIPAQLLAYHTAVAKGTDVDQPRNLAKSVTVE